MELFVNELTAGRQVTLVNGRTTGSDEVLGTPGFFDHRVDIQ